MNIDQYINKSLQDGARNIKNIKAMAAADATKEKESVLSGKRAKFLPTDDNPDNTTSNIKNRQKHWESAAKFLGDVYSGKAKIDKQDGHIVNRGKTLKVSTDATAGYTVPEEFSTLIHTKRHESVYITNLVETRTMDSKTQGVIIEDGLPTASIVAEDTVITDSNPSFKKVDLTAYVVAGLTKATTELVSFSGITPHITEDIMTKLVAQIQRKEDELLLNGSGTSEPTGLSSEIKATGSKFKQITVAGTDTLNTVSASEVDQLVDALDTEYASRGIILCRPDLIPTMRDLALTSATENYGKFFFEATNQRDNSGPGGLALKGYWRNVPVYVSSRILATETISGLAAAKAAPIYFLDPQKALIKGQLDDISVDVSEHAEFAKLNVLFRAFEFFACNIGLGEAVSCLMYRGTS